MIARPYTADDLEPWDALAASARARHFMFQRAYMEYHADRFADASLVVVRGGRLCALLPATRVGDTVISHGGLTFGGLLSGQEQTIDRTQLAFSAVTDALRESGVNRLLYKPAPHIYHLGAAEEELHILHTCGARLVRRDVSAAISPAFRPAPSGSRRRAAAQGRSRGMVFAADDDVEAFMALVAAVLEERHGATPTHTPQEMRMLSDRFSAEIRLFTARLGGELLAGVLLFETPAVAHTQYIAATTHGRVLSASDALITHLINDRYPDRWFDFGISNERDGSLNEGLARYKEGFGARAVVYDRYELALAE
jgi:hypothetical protein